MVASGKHMLFMSGADYGALMNSTVFYKYGPELCRWYEPDVDAIRPYPACPPHCMSVSRTPGVPRRCQRQEAPHGRWAHLPP